MQALKIGRICFNHNPKIHKNPHKIGQIHFQIHKNQTPKTKQIHFEIHKNTHEIEQICLKIHKIYSPQIQNQSPLKALKIQSKTTLIFALFLIYRAAFIYALFKNLNFAKNPFKALKIQQILLIFALKNSQKRTNYVK